MFFSLINPGFSQEENQHKTIVEKVEVNWWQVPIFAVDKHGSPILDLNDTDIEVWLNGQRVEAFNIYKREFIVSAPIQQETFDSHQPKEKNPRALNPQSIFLLFDVAISGIRCTKHSKDIAGKIVNTAGPGMQFYVLTIEPWKGLNYICGPSADKKELLDNINKKVIGKPNERIVDPSKFFARAQAPVQSVQAAAYYMRKAQSIFNAFETLYLVCNSIEDNKFVYFFTEGMSNSIINALKAGREAINDGQQKEGEVKGLRTHYDLLLENAAESLGRGGAVLFIVNPMSVGDASDLVTRSINANDSRYAGSPASYFDREKDLSGEYWLRYMAKESGGKYLEGVKEKIAASLEKMHRAYYEISFPDLPQLKGATRDITINPKRKGIFIHSLRSLEKTKSYPEMNQAEKEILALNLISQNFLLKSKLSCQPARVTQIKKQENSVVYEILLPQEFLDQQLDVYKFWVKDEWEVINLETTTLRTEGEKIELEFEMKGNQDPGLEPYFVLVNGMASAALVRVIGDDWIEPEDPQAQSPSKN